MIDEIEKFLGNGVELDARMNAGWNINPIPCGCVCTCSQTVGDDTMYTNINKSDKVTN